jgi:hypothetical protein
MIGAAVVACTLALAPGINTPDSSAVLERAAFHVRSTDPRALAWIRGGAEGSQTFRELLDRLSDSDLIIYVQVVDHLMNAIGHTYIVKSTETVRYVRIEVVLSGNFGEMVALVGHELQHAVEIAGAPQVRDRQTLAHFYLSKAENWGGVTHFDSVEARMTENRVKRELLGYAGYRSAPADQASSRFKNHE